MWPRLISTESWVRVLDDPTADRYNAYTILRRRNTDKAIGRALEHIKEEDDYLWLNAASYLGSRHHFAATPYLIKSIRHTASRSVEDRIADLEVITNKNFGYDFEKWQEWYLSTNPEVIPDWDSSLGHNPKTNING